MAFIMFKQYKQKYLTSGHLVITFESTFNIENFLSNSLLIFQRIICMRKQNETIFEENKLK